MKCKFNFYITGSFLMVILLSAACSKDFLRKPPVDAIVDASFFQTDEQVLAATAPLYSKVWFDYNTRSSYSIGDMRSGVMYSPFTNQDDVLFKTSGLTLENGSAWRALFNVVGQSNITIQNIEKYAGPAVSANIKAHALAEARFMRAVAYSYLVMNWGPVPIIEDNRALFTDTTVARNTIESVWRYVCEEMEAVADILPDQPIRVGRVTKWSAEGMLARFYLARSGVAANGAGTRDQAMLDKAKEYADRVIKLSGAELLEDYYNLFLYPYDNNSESLFSLQWVFSPGEWGTQNTVQQDLAFGPAITDGDGYGSSKGATWWLATMYEGIQEMPDGTLQGNPLDKRMKATFMLPGTRYPEITQSLPDGTEQPLIVPFTPGTAGSNYNYMNVKKYVIGKSKDTGGNSDKQYYPNDTYMLRLAEMYLIYADAELGNQASTADPTALAYFNKVHTRALPAPYEDPLTADVIFKEKILEFAMEGRAWYDLVAMHYYDKQRVYGILNSQYRYIFFIEPNQFPDPTSWTMTKTVWAEPALEYINAHDGNFYMPIPSAEISQAPNLRKEPVDYFAQ
ncbi:RagB/SusD family nutrient uptake outer membrane protein [Sphingobacterium sp. SGG-5]|uniref:RagB/SusD family nutrient uptake outer membrane protein n=1 Tax=Sphingobacterium sp. SGG-5 TaxID=2710881 RepID=UPI0013EE3349|nr:RagB/SusD family nutrient uptake outer membrane protein [Sphingobacterium sp. SGG-5]NGM61108.1 RagB/SusD family nutrient uptake outer membrane protein [Sphingobacterium sp. SGG-5]